MQTKIIDAGIDWMTITTKDTKRFEEWTEAFALVASEEKARGHKWGSAHILGYKGESCGHAFLGKRTDGAMVRLTSSAAQTYGHLFSPEACHVTRIDLQVTVQFDYPAQNFLKRAYDHARVQPVKNGRPPVYSLLENSLGGSTIYVGSRSSMRYGRIYDKGEESGTELPGRMFRWELEIKDQLADQAVQMLAYSANPERQLLALVGSFFDERALPVTWSIPRDEERFSLPRILPDDAGSLKWLNGPVATVVARLATSVGWAPVLRSILGKAYPLTSDATICEEIAVELESYAESLAMTVQGS